MGNGWFSQNLTYKHWYLLNNAQRAHQNFVESLPMSIVTLLVMGLLYPTVTLVYGVLAVLSRYGYAYFYTKSGPNARMPFVMIERVGLLVLMLWATGLLTKRVFWREEA
mmetsp:Transcript_39481/g.60284  ORF Transcript_39481/g.60284 Transcript_39481/m.60284 type:complete len:109 (-) Transcript_39481:35-361(-)|eukprot:CAMPEP_0170494982 /NCGR_PEP_ID=MMETSP0208-20121228/14951_1 /TAXON_ID=197538 /ORGANISM="Strombidium inclinatum, Strain S3" /LENGTH=108 /DNA_ID=CAMNT_0010771111 /DNA_START=208 /DNA_END=534 /DNA_ORIENTATION=-